MSTKQRQKNWALDYACWANAPFLTTFELIGESRFTA
jgi:hypothetical protein